MAEQLESVSGAVLKWARLSLGLSISEVAAEMGKEEQVIEDWENNRSHPTYSQLEKLAYTILKRPLAIFFLAAPPHEEPIATEFRTLYSGTHSDLAKDTLLALREAMVRKIYIEELAPETSTLVIGSIGKLLAERKPKEAAEAFRSHSGVSVPQIASTKSAEEALSIWRNAIESLGVYVFKRSFKQNDISGFCLTDAKFPIIYLNNKNSFTRQIFTLIHEYAHIALGSNDIDSISNLPNPTSSQKTMERLCDKFAGEVLVPTSNFREQFDRQQQDIAALAKYFRVSPAVIATKLLELNIIEKEEHAGLMQFYFKDNWREPKSEDDKSGGGNYYSTQLQYLSKNYFHTAYSNFAQGRISANRLADFLGVKASNIDNLTQRAVGVRER